jgi:predicted nuclease of predicted toxin-antitoxin system
MIKLLVDENVHADIVVNLRNAGFDVITAIDVGLTGCKDYKILEYSKKELENGKLGAE